MSYTNGLDKPSDYFNTKLYSGDGSSDHDITGVGFQPDLVWVKRRNSATRQLWCDSVRGATKMLESDTSDAEATNTTQLISFDTDGFSVGSNGDINNSSGTFVSWNWLGANGTASNSNGSITSTVSANTTAGFSIVSWTGSGSSATLGHGLGATPKLIIVKNRTDNVNWFLYNHSVITPSSTNKIFMTLNETKAIESNGTATTFTSVSDTTFGVGTDNIINGSSDNMIAYVLAEKKGYSKFNQFTGNGSTNGTYVYTGFKPAWVMGKQTNATEDWWVFDNKRDTFNLTQKKLRANSSAAESSDSSKGIDFLSNGFKLRTSNGEFNSSGGTYIYMAFAENPFVSSTGIPGLAR